MEASSDSNVGFEVAGVLKSLDVSEGDFVSTGQLIARLDTRQQEAALQLVQAQEREVTAQLELARLTLQRAETLHKQDLISQRELDEALLRVQTTVARLKTSQASVRNAVVSRKLAEPGSIIGPSTPIVRLVSVGGREAHVGLSPKFAELARPGKVYPVLVDNTVINARLRSVGQDVDPQTLTVLAVLNLPDDQPVRVGQTVALQLEEEVASLGGWLPITALLEGDKGLWTVLVVRQGGDGSTVTVRESVEVIFNRSDRVFVRGTLTDGDSVVSGGMQRLSPGAPVEVVPAIRVTN